MRVADFDFDLPEELIAQMPPDVRGSSRLLVANEPHKLRDQIFYDIVDCLNCGDLLVFNNTKVLKARLHGHKETGGKVEVLIEKVLDEQKVLAHVKASKAPKTGTFILFDKGIRAEMSGREGELFLLSFSCEKGNIWTVLDQIGHMPLPPYIEREDTEDDRARYQTVYAQHEGAVAAPTAGLHFTEDILKCLSQKGVAFAYVTLHVGAGTFQPVRVEDTVDHVMHSEWFNVPEDTVSAVTETHKAGKKVWAVGTTSMRSLEAAALSGSLCAGAQETDIFITPGFSFKVVDGLLTNFHLPKSTLLMLVSAFAGFDCIREIYQHAITRRYRFFSYGDAMLLTRKEHV